MTVTTAKIDGSSLDTQYTDDYTESGDVAVTLAVTQVDQPGVLDDIIQVTYFSSAVGPTATMTYSIRQLG
jgi:hypothetical protein